ncbi:hypothetical protein F7734_53440 [Scytonema sp. UIC 10036]|uniref:hypothetical protein n=1 Tax=Scytonema sp. UIC 10036 TaxID=2304196 RepID=UPI0012DADC8D|nr:hypothetical protein [Scytonema sp. UIC 10036]MUH00613.1 hypothetical protein [Scytonema sp. UIC 10036]
MPVQLAQLVVAIASSVVTYLTIRVSVFSLDLSMDWVSARLVEGVSLKSSDTEYRWTV